MNDATIASRLRRLEEQDIVRVVAVTDMVAFGHELLAFGLVRHVEDRDGSNNRKADTAPLQRGDEPSRHGPLLSRSAVGVAGYCAPDRPTRSRRHQDGRSNLVSAEGLNLTGGSVTYSNNLEKIETIRDDGLIEGADPTIAALTSRIDVRFADTTLIDLAAGGTPVDLELAYTLSAQSKLVLTAHEVYLPKPKLAVEGPGGVQASFDFRGAKERCRRSDAHGYAHQRPRWISLRMMLPGFGVGHGRLIHRSLLRLIPESVDECDGRMTFSLSLGVPGEDRDSVGAEGERRTPQSVRPERSSGSAGSPPSPIAARSAPAIARRKHAGAARRRIPADPARCRAHRTAR